MINTSLCERDNLCVDCDDKECIHAGNIEADCPLYHCNNDHHCDSCELMMQFQKEARGLKDEGRESSNVR